MGRRKKSELTESESNENEFPFDLFPWKLVYNDGNETRKCYFQTEVHRDKHILRHKLKMNQLKLSYKYDSPGIK